MFSQNNCVRQIQKKKSTNFFSIFPTLYGKEKVSLSAKKNTLVASTKELAVYQLQSGKSRQNQQQIISIPFIHL